MKSQHIMIYNRHNFSLKSVSKVFLHLHSLWSKAGRAFFVLTAALVLLAVAGCASISPAVVESPEEIVSKRAQERLDALIAGDLPKAWAFTTPAYRQRVTNPMHYSAVVGGSGGWINAKVDNVVCDTAESCNVRILITYKLLRPAIENTRSLDERWIKIEDQWWIFHRR
ncbi:hypothetical protein [Nitrincola alkalilacustris]|uniref:hypothetical protein n=1 Tax=Nitrincola alkalilacustris TaxID=1571224 RepID=UPI00124CF816|nr:hypothetical protein [Nitrincola alkalilacustris]